MFLFVLPKTRDLLAIYCKCGIIIALHLMQKPFALGIIYYLSIIPRFYQKWKGFLNYDRFFPPADE